MGSIMGAIADDERQYLERCRRYGEKPVHSAVNGYDVYGEHATSLRLRDAAGAKAIMPVRLKTLAVRTDYVNCVLATDAPIWASASDDGFSTLYAFAYVREVKEGEDSPPTIQIELLRSDGFAVKKLAQALFDAIDTGAVKVDARSKNP